MDTEIPDRYAQNPMLAIVENYILDAIGHLEPVQAAKLNAIVCRTFGGNDWRKVVRDQFSLPPETEQQLRDRWKQRQEEADAIQEETTPEIFAREAADEIFDGLGA